jgi:hypothetical protein
MIGIELTCKSAQDIWGTRCMFDCSAVYTVGVGVVTLTGLYYEIDKVGVNGGSSVG